MDEGEFRFRHRHMPSLALEVDRRSLGTLGPQKGLQRDAEDNPI
jgi:hypothetical protein